MTSVVFVALDTGVALLGAGVIVLAASAVLTSVSLPAVNWQWRRRSVPPVPPVPPVLATHRRVITGRPVVHRPIEPIALPRAPTQPERQSAPAPDDPRHSELDEAVATIEHLLDTEPEFLARLMMQWIRGTEAQLDGTQ